MNVVLQTAYQNDAILFFNQAKSAGFTPRVVIGAGGGYSLADTAKAVGAGINGVFDLDFPQASINPQGAPGPGQVPGGATRPHARATRNRAIA